ncbi:tetratricopeptide repeat protein [Cognatiyoonia sp.]|uniref:tetratricopeptide repeat protein n=1 Tax=Cognatiyoonia sp. TaxID=2211652 RepID=UPI003F697D91
MTRITFALAAVLSLAFTPLAAQDSQKGWDAYRAGDYATALQEWTPLAEAGNAYAQFSLGVMYRNGRGVLQDDAEAGRWYRLAADQGYAPAQFNLGNMYRTGQGVLQDYAEAVRLWRLAADQGIADAQTNLGVMYSNGHGVIQDNVMAHMWYNIGAANGNELGGTFRDRIAEGMTQQAIEQAQAMARECLGSGYKNCGY